MNVNSFFELQFTPLRSDYKRAMNIILYDTLLSKKEILITLSGLIIGILLWIFVSHSVLVIYLIAFCLLMLMFILLYYYLIPLWVDRNRVKGLSRVEMLFDDNGFESHMQHMQSRVEWKYFKDVWETNEFFILLANGSHFSLIPKRAFEDDMQVNRFKVLLEKHINPIVSK